MQIAYRGPRIDRAALLRYLVSYRRHPGFHEHCVERIFVDVAARCRRDALTVDARFTRRGGVDINPVSHQRGRLADRRRTSVRARPVGRMAGSILESPA